MKLTLIFFLTGCFTAYAQLDSLKLNLGQIQNGKYTNPYFNMVFSLPEDFYIQSEEDLFEIAELAKNELNIVSDFSQSIVLFMSKERNYVVPTDFNSQFMISACSKNVGGAAIKDEHDYIDYLNKFQLAILPETAFVSETTTKELGGLLFFRTETSIPAGGLYNYINQVHYVRFFDDVLLDINISFHDNEDNDALFESFFSIRFYGD